MYETYIFLCSLISRFKEPKLELSINDTIIFLPTTLEEIFLQSIKWRLNLEFAYSQHVKRFK